MDIKQDPNAIPNYNSSGRIGELQPGEPEQEQSSVQLDPSADGDGAASGEVSPQSVREVPLDKGSRAAVADGEVLQADPSKTGGGAVDGLVGAP